MFVYFSKMVNDFGYGHSRVYVNYYMLYLNMAYHEWCLKVHENKKLSESHLGSNISFTTAMENSYRS